jgi:hypothetical protein
VLSIHPALCSVTIERVVKQTTNKYVECLRLSVQVRKQFLSYTSSPWPTWFLRRESFSLTWRPTLRSCSVSSDVQSRHTRLGGGNIDQRLLHCGQLIFFHNYLPITTPLSYHILTLPNLNSSILPNQSFFFGQDSLYFFIRHHFSWLLTIHGNWIY